MEGQNDNMGGEENKNMGGGEDTTNTEVEAKGSAGPVIGIIVILAIIILGALYFWGQNEGEGALPVDYGLDAITTQSEGDDTASIEADLDATDIEALDSELN